LLRHNWRLVLNRGLILLGRLLILLRYNCDLDAELELGLRSTEKLLPNRWSVGVECDEVGSTVGETFENSLLGIIDAKKSTKLVSRTLAAKPSKRNRDSF
jgi:hypothetical protein